MMKWWLTYCSEAVDHYHGVQRHLHVDQGLAEGSYTYGLRMVSTEHPPLKHH